MHLLRSKEHSRTFLLFALAWLTVVCGCQPAARDARNEPATDTTASDATSARDRTAGGGPRLVGTATDVTVELPARFEEVLADSVGNFATVTSGELSPGILGGPGGGGFRYPWSERQAPFAVIADFDGNGANDVVLLQRSPEMGRVVAVLDVPPRPRVIELRRWARADAGEGGPMTSFYLMLQPAGAMHAPDFGSGVDTTITLRREGVVVAYFGQAARTFWYEDGRFESRTTAD